MSIAKPHSLFGQSIDIGRGDFRFLIKATRIAITHIIHEDNENIGEGSMSNRCKGSREQYGREVSCVGFHSIIQVAADLTSSPASGIRRRKPSDRISWTSKLILQVGMAHAKLISYRGAAQAPALRV